MNATVMTDKNNETLVKPSLLDEMQFFAKLTLAMSAIVILVASAWF
ncbi:hypothetical protein [Vibrio maerlii]|nr:hypothetical protein [Vibrio maerlii]